MGRKLLPISVNTALRLSIDCFTGFGAGAGGVCATTTEANGAARKSAKLALTDLRRGRWLCCIVCFWGNHVEACATMTPVQKACRGGRLDWVCRARVNTLTRLERCPVGSRDLLWMSYDQHEEGSGYRCRCLYRAIGETPAPPRGGVGMDA